MSRQFDTFGKPNGYWCAAVAVILIASLAGCGAAYGLKGPAKPDFTSFEDVEARKAAFFDYLLPLVELSNREILQTRHELVALRQRHADLSRRELARIENIAGLYDVEAFDVSSDDDWNNLLRRVDIVPASLALAQAANESAWGTSRFASQGSNFFGQWCFDPGCGIVPLERPEDAVYEVADYDNVQHSVDRYIHNLNQHSAYSTLREIRARLREQKQAITGFALAEGLTGYSERGQEYVEMIRTIISANNLERHDPRV